jgi:hypothetical protein
MRPWIEHSAALATIAACMIAIPTLIIVKRQYTEDIGKSRVENTLAYVTRYRTDPIDHDRMIIDAKLATAEGVSIFNGDHKDYAKRVHEFDRKNDLDGPFIKLISFYDEVYVCVERDICDLRTILILVGRNIRSDYVWAESEIPLLQAESISDVGFGCGFTSLAIESKYYLNHAQPSKHIALPEMAKCPNLDSDG